MMKRRIAVFGCGWSNEYLMSVNAIFNQFAVEHHADLFYFINYSDSGNDSNEELREANIYRLPDLKWFDGAVILGSTLHLETEFSVLTSAIKEAQIPAVCLGYRLEGISSFECDNYHGMHELVEHLVLQHHVKDIVYIGGPADNQESMLRKKAMTDVLEKYGHSLATENILCGNWNYYETQYVVVDWYKKNQGKLPDAFVCANDVMAMGCYVGLSKCGVAIEDVKVTGFDSLTSGSMFSPSITSVDPGWEEMARRSMEHLFYCMDNGDEVIYQTVESHGDIRESCGCYHKKGSELSDGKEIFLGYERMVSSSYLGGHMCELSNFLSDIRKKEDIPKFFRYVLSTDHRYEGEEFYLCFVEDFFETLDANMPLKNSGYTKKMELIGGIRNGEVVKGEIFDTQTILPNYDPDKETVDQYLILCLSSRNECYGYIVMVNNTAMLYDYSMFVWSFNMGQDVERMRQNFRLEELNQRLAVLSVTDALTGVYNRMGCEKVAFPLIENCYKAGKSAVMLFIDINKMKIINDTYGHEQGDVAIRTTANALQLAVPDDWVVVRYGGDEFLVAGECANEEMAEEISTRIQKLLAKAVKEKRLPYPITVGIGAVYVKPEDELDLYRCLRIADAKMYRMKKERGETE